jgi:hypothetical protein
VVAEVHVYAPAPAFAAVEVVVAATVLVSDPGAGAEVDGISQGAQAVLFVQGVSPRGVGEGGQDGVPVGPRAEARERWPETVPEQA